MSSLHNLPPQETAPRRNIFIGDDGLRSGWRIAIFLVITGGLIWLAFFLLGPFLRRFGQGDALGMILSESTLFGCVLISTAVMASIEHRPMAVYGLPLQQAFRGYFWRGVLWGFVNLTVVMLCMMAVRVYSPGGIELSGAQILKFGFVWGVGFLLVGFAEEYLFRGYLLYTMTSRMGFWPATILLSVIFAFAHGGNPGENWMGLLGIVIIAIFFCVTVQRTGTLWFAVGIHMSYDWGESFFYSVPDSGTYIHGHLLHAQLGGSKWLSGGSVGPEASLFAIFADLIMLFLFIWFYRDRRFPTAKPVAVPPSQVGGTR